MAYLMGQFIGGFLGVMVVYTIIWAIFWRGDAPQYIHAAIAYVVAASFYGLIGSNGPGWDFSGFILYLPGAILLGVLLYFKRKTTTGA